jgi:hypothetical protein
MRRLAQIPRVNQIAENRMKSLNVKKEKRNAVKKMPVNLEDVVNLDPVRRKIRLPVKRIRNHVLPKRERNPVGFLWISLERKRKESKLS